MTGAESRAIPRIDGRIGDSERPFLSKNGPKHPWYESRTRTLIRDLPISSVEELHAYSPSAAVVSASLLGVVQAQVPQTMTYQATLADSAGIAAADGSHEITFSIYGSATSTTPLWVENHPSITTTSGVMTVVLGSISPISIDMEDAAVLLAREGGPSFVNLRVIPGEEEAVLASLRQIWKGYGLMRPFEGVTFTQHIEDEGTVRGLQDTRAIMRVIALLAVMIACLGLLGIAAYAAEARIKEMGIRKSIGATAQSLVVLLSRDQAMLVAISVVIALPGAVFFNDWWMGMYPNRAELTAGVVAGPAILLLALALATVATQSARAALTNPVESLKYE